MFKTVRTKLILSFLFFSFICFLIALVLFQIDRYKDQISRSSEIINNIYNTFLNQTKQVSDFFDYEVKNPVFYKDIDSQIFQFYQSRKEVLNQQIKSLHLNKHWGFDLEYDLSVLEDKLVEFDSTFIKMKDLLKKRGFKENGLEGEMRFFSHQLEQFKGVDMVLLLSLRRFEKDYILRNEIEYIIKHDSAAQFFERELKKSFFSSKTKDSIISILHHYQSSFHEYCEIEKQIGLKNNTGLKKQLDVVTNEIQFQLININVDTEKSKVQIFNQITIYIAVFISILIVCSVLLGLYFARKLTEDLSKLSENIDLFVKSEFSDTSNIETDKNDEVGVLIRNYLLMKTETVSLINNFKLKVESRTNEIFQKKIEIELQKEEIEAQRDTLFERNILISKQQEDTERQNKSMLDSINYAKTIQESMMPPASDIQDCFNDAFVLYLPKDIISGDFYSISHLNLRGVKSDLLVAADCTGHGVPGALMSMMAISLLNEIVSKDQSKNVAEILNKLRLNIVKSLHKGKNIKVSNDGLDIALCLIDKTNMIAEFAGANRPLYLIRNNELNIYKGDKMPIGNFINQNKGFSKCVFEIQKHDRIYLFTDGYADQFGGNDNRKFMNKRFKELLLSIHHLEMKEQRLILHNSHLKWRGGMAQLDDILVIGIEI